MTARPGPQIAGWVMPGDTFGRVVRDVWSPGLVSTACQ